MTTQTTPPGERAAYANGADAERERCAKVADSIARLIRSHSDELEKRVARMIASDLGDYGVDSEVVKRRGLAGRICAVVLNDGVSEDGK